MDKSLKWVALAGLTTFACVAFVACAPLNAKQARKKLEDKGYVVSVFGMTGEGVSEHVSAYYISPTTGKREEVEAVRFYSIAKAQKRYEEAKYSYGNGVGDIVVEREGSWVVLGTQKAVEDFLG